MTHQTNPELLNTVLQLLTAEGSGGFAESIRLLVNEASQARVRAEPKTATGLVEWFYGLLTHGPADGGTRLSVAMAAGRTALTALLYGGSVATNCREMTTYYPGGRFWMPIRSKSGVFYDENSAFNSYFRGQTGFDAQTIFKILGRAKFGSDKFYESGLGTGSWGNGYY